jgi:hypothetical protein
VPSATEHTQRGGPGATGRHRPAVDHRRLGRGRDATLRPCRLGWREESVGTILRFDVRDHRREGLLALARIGRAGGRFELVSAVGSGSSGGTACVLGGWSRQSGKDGASRTVQFKAIVTWPVPTLTLFSA